MMDIVTNDEAVEKTDAVAVIKDLTVGTRTDRHLEAPWGKEVAPVTEITKGDSGSTQGSVLNGQSCLK